MVQRTTGDAAKRPVPRRYVEQAASLSRSFATDAATDGRLIHTDLHYFNVLAAGREPWLVIDPKPLSGDPSYEIAPLLSNRWEEAVSSGDRRRAIRDRFHMVIDAAGFDEDRARDWVVVRMLVNVKWSLDKLAELGIGYDAMPADVVGWISDCITIAKAVQD